MGTELQKRPDAPASRDTAGQALCHRELAEKGVSASLPGGSSHREQPSALTAPLSLGKHLMLGAAGRLLQVRRKRRRASAELGARCGASQAVARWDSE